MYNFCGVKVTRKRFWELSEVASDLRILEKELDKEEGRIIDSLLVDELLKKSKGINEGISNLNLINEKINNPKLASNKTKGALLFDDEIDQILNLKENSNNLNCSNCGSRLVLKKSKWGSFLACSNICDCETIEVLG